MSEDNVRAGLSQQLGQVIGSLTNDDDDWVRRRQLERVQLAADINIQVLQALKGVPTVPGTIDQLVERLGRLADRAEELSK